MFEGECYFVCPQATVAANETDCEADGTTSARKSTAYGPILGRTDLLPLTDYEFYVIPRDADGNNVTFEGTAEDIIVTTDRSDMNASTIVVSIVDGKIVCHFRTPNNGGPINFSVGLRGAGPISGNPYTVSVVLPACVHGQRVSNSLTCVCHSGYSGTLCDTHALSSCVANQAEQKANTHIPSLDKNPAAMYFARNQLFVSALGPYVGNRTYLGIDFVGANDTRCSLGTIDSFWTANINSTSCNDRFSLDLPWRNHRSCGFSTNTGHNIQDESFIHYRATFTVHFSDNIGEVMGQALSRKSSASFDVFVHFPRTVNVVLDYANVSAPAGFKIALTSFQYNRDTETLDLQLTSAIQWPNKLLDSMSLIVEGGATHVDAVVVNDTECTNDMNSVCKQSIKIDEDLFGDECSFDGNYTLLATVITCRDSLACTQKVEELHFTIRDSDVCGQVSTEAKYTARLEAVESDLMTVIDPPTFFVGERAYFVTTITSENHIDLTYTKIVAIDVFDDEADEIVLYDVNNQTLSTSIGARMQILAPQNDGRNGFTMVLENMVFQVEPSNRRVFDLVATGTMLFAGNEDEHRRGVHVNSQKRKPTASFASTTRVAVNKRVVNEAVKPASIFAVGVMPTIAVAAGSAMTVLIVALIVAVAVKRSRLN